MQTSVGLDIGSSVTKLAAVREDGLLIGLHKAENSDRHDPETLTLDFLRSLQLRPQDIAAVILTGIGALRVRESFSSMPLRHVDEFAATAHGALHLTGKDSAIVVSMGTGTALLRADTGGAEHIGGSGVGGGTVIGLCGKLYGLSLFEDIVAAAKSGDAGHVDLRIKDLSDTAYISLPPELTSCNFGKINPDASDADMVCGIINMILESIGVMAVMACRGTGINQVILTGSLTRLPQAKTVYSTFRENFGINFIIPQQAAFATAIGAAHL